MSHPSNSNIHYDLLLRLKKVFVKGGDKRIKHTLPALIFELIKLSMLMHQRQTNPNEEEESKDVANDDDNMEQPAVEVT